MALIPFTVAVIVAVPFRIALTRPDDDTDATLELLLDQFVIGTAD